MDENVSKARNYTFTINNYSESDLQRFEDLASALTKHHYICYGFEVAPSTGTKHIQGYIQLDSAQRYSFLHNYFDFKKDNETLKFHVEIANGTPEQNKVYCQKDGDFYEFGVATAQGARTDLKEIKEKIKENPKNLHQIIDEHGNNYQQLKYAESLSRYYFDKRNPDNPPKVFWIFGSTGVGKTKLVSKTFEDVCYVSSYKWLGTDYVQNECLCLDDFREGDLLFNVVLKITDRYPFTLEYKGGQIPLNSPYIVFTSPKCINLTFITGTEDLKQLKRRIIEIDLDSVANIEEIDLKDLDEKYIYRPVNDPRDNF